MPGGRTEFDPPNLSGIPRAVTLGRFVEEDRLIVDMKLSLFPSDTFFSILDEITHLVYLIPDLIR